MVSQSLAIHWSRLLISHSIHGRSYERCCNIHYAQWALCHLHDCLILLKKKIISLLHRAQTYVSLTYFTMWVAYIITTLISMLQAIIWFALLDHVYLFQVITEAACIIGRCAKLLLPLFEHNASPQPDSLLHYSPLSNREVSHSLRLLIFVFRLNAQTIGIHKLK